MTRPYSNDLRERVVVAVERGEMSYRQAVAHYGVAASTAIKWVWRLRTTGSVSPSKIGGYCPKKIRGPWRSWLLERCQSGRFTLRGLVGELAERGLKVDYRLVWAFVHEEKLTHKKTRFASEQDWPDVARRRTQWLRYRHRIDPSRGVHRRDLDEDQHGAAARLGAAR